MKILINLGILWLFTGIATLTLTIILPSIGAALLAMFILLSLISLFSVIMGFLVYAILAFIVVLIFGRDN